MNDKQMFDFADDVMLEAYQDISPLPKTTERIIKHAIVFKLRTLDKAKKKPENTVTKQDVAFKMFSEGKTQTEVKEALRVVKSTAHMYYHKWKTHMDKQQKAEKPEAWYKEKYPNLPDNFYQALAKGIIDESSIRQNRMK
jgi:hypothetical protein